MDLIDSSAFDKQHFQSKLKFKYYPAVRQNLFGSLDIDIWKLFEICILRFGIFFAQRLNLYQQ